MIGRPLAILSEGRLSDSQIRALTLASLGWLELVLSPNEVAEIRRRRGLGRIIMPEWTPREKQRKNDDEERMKRIREDDEEILAIIRTFISCQNLEIV